MFVKLKGQPLDMAVVVVLVSVEQSKEEVFDMFYEQVEVLQQCKSAEVVVLLGDMNANVLERVNQEMLLGHLD